MEDYMENKFTDKDKERLIKYLNFVFTKANFNMNSKEVLEYHGLLSFMQKELLPKVEANIFEIKSIKEDKEE